MFKQAKKWKFIAINPNEDAVKPKLVKNKRNFYNEEQVRVLLNCLEKEDIKAQEWDQVYLIGCELESCYDTVTVNVEEYVNRIQVEIDEELYNTLCSLFE